MKRRIITSLVVLSIAVGTFVIWRHEQGTALGSHVFAVGDVNINWGVPDGSPIFTVVNMLPGDSESRTVEAVNSASVARPIAVRGDKTSESKNFASILDLVISENGTDRYGGTSPTGPKTLQNFFDETATPSSVPLSVLGPGNTTHYTFKVTFPVGSGNAFQQAEVVFNITFGIDTPIPPECKDINFNGATIYGTQGNDTIYGTSKNDLIFGLEGNDKIFGHGGDDCIVGGPGNDELRGETGNDIILGGDGNDLVIGGTGNDLLIGGAGNDDIRGEDGTDVIDGGIGNDTITGGNGNDTIHGGDGNDTIFGENGDDIIFGDAGADAIDGGNGNDTIHGGDDNDTINGKAGNDTIIGDGGTDSVDGSTGTDTCDAEVKVHCEL